jgi:hypothetical protein
MALFAMARGKERSAPALAVLEITLAGTLQKIRKRTELSQGDKEQQSRDAIVQCFKEANDAGTRLFFDPAAMNELAWKDICHSVAIEELHACYFARCNIQTTAEDPRNRGALYVVYGRKGMGKTYAYLSLLTMKHSRAPRHGYYFSGGTTFLTGDDYYNQLLDDCLGRDDEPFLSTFTTGMFNPSKVAIMIMKSLPTWDPAVENPGPKPGILDIPGVRIFFNTHGEGTGGSPDVVFDDVNIHLEEGKWENKEDMKRDLFEMMGKAGVFFRYSDGHSKQTGYRGVCVYFELDGGKVPSRVERWNESPRIQKSV